MTHSNFNFNTRKFVFKKASTQINLNNTKTTTIANQIESRLKKDLSAIVEIMDRDYNTNPSVDVATLRRVYGNTLKEIIRAAVEDAYQAASEYVASSYTVKAFITETDLSNIRTITTTYENNFWNGYTRRQHKDDTVLPVELQDPRPDKNNISLAESIAIGIVAATIAAATKAKTTQISQLQKDRQQQALLTQITGLATLGLSEAFNIDNTITTEPVQEYIFKTSEDEKVCPICSNLEGTKYSLDDPSIPTIPDSTHINCRCRLLLVIDDVIQEG